MTATLRVLQDFPADVFAVSASGRVDGEAYEKVLIPEIKRRLRRHDRIRLLFVLSEDFEHFTTGAAWDDARFGLAHLHDFSRIALVTDEKWIAHGMRLFAPLIRGEVRVFGLAERSGAEAWIRAADDGAADVADPPSGGDFPV